VAVGVVLTMYVNVIALLLVQLSNVAVIFGVVVVLVYRTFTAATVSTTATMEVTSSTVVSVRDIDN